MSDVRITVSANGSFKVEGPFTLVDHEGNVIETRDDKPTYLCRCGGSVKKPFCDGTHSRIGFQGANQAVAEAQERTGREG